MREPLLNTVTHYCWSGPAITLTGSTYFETVSVGGPGNGQQAWNAVYAKHHNDGPAIYDEPVDFRTEQGQDADDYSTPSSMLEARGRLHENVSKYLGR